MDDLAIMTDKPVKLCDEKIKNYAKERGYFWNGNNFVVLLLRQK
jgi:hypothetical protein